MDVVAVLYARSAIVERNLEIRFVNTLAPVTLSNLTYLVELVPECFHGGVKFGETWPAGICADVVQPSHNIDTLEALVCSCLACFFG